MIIKLQTKFLILFSFLLQFDQWDPFNTGISFIIYKITISLVLFISLFNFVNSYNLKSARYYYTPLILFFFTQLIVSYINIRPGYADYFDLIFLLNFLIFVIILNLSLSNSRIISNLLLAFACGGILASSFFLLGLNIEEEDGRISLFGLSNQNGIGMNMAISLLILIHHVFIKKGVKSKGKYLFLLFFPQMINFLLASGSRSGFLSFFIGLIVLLLLNNNRINVKKILVSSIVIFGIFVFINNSKNYSLLNSRLLASFQEGDLSGRDVFWTDIWVMITKNPLFGIGKTGYKFEFMNITGFYMSPHNMFMEVLVTSGIVGFIFFIVFFFRILRAATFPLLKKGEYFPLVLFIPILIMTMVGHPFGAKITWLIFAYIISNYRLYKINFFTRKI